MNRNIDISANCTLFHRYPIFSKRHSVLCKVYNGYCGTSEIEHGFCACTVDNPLAKARRLSLRTGAQTMLYLSHSPAGYKKNKFSAFCFPRNQIFVYQHTFSTFSI